MFGKIIKVVLAMGLVCGMMSGKASEFDPVAKVANPIPLLVQDKITNVDMHNTCTNFLKKVSDLAVKHEANLTIFSENCDLSTNWRSKIDLLRISVDVLSASVLNQTDAETILNELVLITNNGFFSKVNSAIQFLDREDVKAELREMLGDTIQSLWQARYLLEYKLSIDAKEIEVCKIPELCALVSEGASVIAKLSAESKNENISDVSLYFWKIADAYGYYDQSSVIKSDEAKKKIKGILEGKQNQAEEIMLRVFE